MRGTRRLLVSAASACALLLSASPALAASPAPTFTPDAWFQPAAPTSTGNFLQPGPTAGSAATVTETWGTTVVVYWSSGASSATGSTTGGTTGTATGGTTGSTTGGTTGTATGGTTGSTTGGTTGTATGGATGSTTGSTTGTATGGTTGSTTGGTTGTATGGTTGTATGGTTGTPPAATGAPGNLSPDAAEIESWTNATRAQNGLPPLADNALLDKIALLKCQDMIQNNYFGHDSPTYGTPLQMQQAFGVQARIMGAENIAGARDTALAWFMLVHSPGHLANILYNGLTDQGAAVVPYGTYGVYVCQEFTGN